MVDETLYVIEGKGADFFLCFGIYLIGCDLKMDGMDKTNPHRILGLDQQGKRIVLYAPREKRVYLEVLGKKVRAQALEDDLFEYLLDEPIAVQDYRIFHRGGLVSYDPYSFVPTFSEKDGYLFNRGRHWTISRVMGGRLCIHQNIEGVKFAVWAPHADWGFFSR